MPTLKINFNPRELNKLIGTLEAVKEGVKEGGDKLIKDAAIYGKSVAEENFSNALYDGVNDVKVKVEKTSSGYYQIKAYGDALQFIEYGTGVHFGAPLAGLSGQGKGKNDYWFYNTKSGNKFTAGGEYAVYHSKKTGVDRVKYDSAITHGNPPNNCMLNAKESIKEYIQLQAKQYFHNLVNKGVGIKYSEASNIMGDYLFNDYD